MAKKEWIERPDNMTRIVRLEFPIQMGTEGDSNTTIESLTLKRPKVGDILKTSKLGDNEDERRLEAIARVSGQITSLIKEVYASDWERINDAYDELRFPSPTSAASV